jgi:hypothetical protein
MHASEMTRRDWITPVFWLSFRIALNDFLPFFILGCLFVIDRIQPGIVVKNITDRVKNQTIYFDPSMTFRVGKISIRIVKSIDDVNIYAGELLLEKFSPREGIVLAGGSPANETAVFSNPRFYRRVKSF